MKTRTKQNIDKSKSKDNGKSKDRSKNETTAFFGLTLVQR